ncbi:host cell division inhibitor Icd-like protein [Phytobacter sp. RSE-02]|uniref:host cell division inhibitor Icd-like protein n=1 Tax=Phytobacter sp. RSE-02 TaxID=3229229 RepID=UPI00339D7077
MKKNLKCVSLQSKVIHTLVVLRYENSEAQKDGNPCWASNHNVSEAYTMAYLHSTQTRPEKTYQWRFLALNRSDMSAKFCRVSLEAPTEHDARMVLAPFFILSFAGRLPVQEVANV